MHVWPRSLTTLASIRCPHVPVCQDTDAWCCLLSLVSTLEQQISVLEPGPSPGLDWAAGRRYLDTGEISTEVPDIYWVSICSPSLIIQSLDTGNCWADGTFLPSHNSLTWHHSYLDISTIQTPLISRHIYYNHYYLDISTARCTLHLYLQTDHVQWPGQGQGAHRVQMATFLS